MRTEEECIIWFRNHGLLNGFLENISPDRSFHSLYEDSNAEMINAAFTWADTPQGREFWRSYSDEFRDWFHGNNEPVRTIVEEIPEDDGIMWGPATTIPIISGIRMDAGTNSYYDALDSILDSMVKAPATRRVKKEVNSKFKKSSKVKLVTTSSKFVDSNDDMDDMKNKTVTISKICECCYTFDEKDKKLDGCFYYIKEDGGTNSYTSEMFEEIKKK